MIDIDKYERHTPTPWTVNVHTIGKDREITAIVIESNMTTHSNCVLAEVEVENKYAEADAQLIADAPLLLAEVKRLQKELDAAEDVILYALDRVGNDDDAKKVFEDFLEGIK
tara:strand:+ start:151 stop:486 length:336 start_codon:yes stop_codon:yes gene_type:complete